MRSAERVPLYWQRPPEWDTFLESVEDKHSATSLYAGFEIEQAWAEYHTDHPAEGYVDQLLERLGSRERGTREKTSRDRESAAGDERATIRIRREVKDEMAAYATEKKVPKHRVLRAVICWYLDGGLLGHIEKKLAAAVPEAEEQLADLDPSDDRDLTADEKKPMWLAKNVRAEEGHGFTANDFGNSLEEMPFRGGDTGHMREKWLPDVLDRIDYTEHPNNPDLYIPEEQAEEIAEEEGIDREAPAIDRKDPTNLTDEEWIHGLRIELSRRAAKRSNGLRAMPASDVRDDIFDRVRGRRSVKRLMDQAAQILGFETDEKPGERRLKCDLEEVADPVVLNEIGFGNPDGDRSDAPDIEQRMDTLMDATPTADGGVSE